MKKIAALLVLAGSAVAQAQNVGAILTDGDAVFRIGSTSGTAHPTNNTSTARASIDFRISGGTSGVDSGFDMNWYVGTAGRTREFGLGGVTGNFTRTVTANSVGYSVLNAFGIAGLNANVSYVLWDGGANTAQVRTVLSLTNNTGADISNLDIFFSVDHDVAGTAGGDTFDALSIVGSDRVLVQRDALVAGGPWAMALIGFGAQASGAGGFTALNTQLTDTSADFTTLADLGSAGNATAADYAQFVQWRLNLASGASTSVTADMLGGNGGAAVPTPGAAALLGLGALASTRRRRA